MHWNIRIINDATYILPMTNMEGKNSLFTDHSIDGQNSLWVLHNIPEH